MAEKAERTGRRDLLRRDLRRAVGVTPSDQETSTREDELSFSAWLAVIGTGAQHELWSKVRRVLTLAVRVRMA